MLRWASAAIPETNAISTRFDVPAGKYDHGLILLRARVGSRAAANVFIGVPPRAALKRSAAGRIMRSVKVAAYGTGTDDVDAQPWSPLGATRARSRRRHAWPPHKERFPAREPNRRVTRCSQSARRRAPPSSDRPPGCHARSPRN